MKSEALDKTKSSKCAICKKKVEAEFFPFCSQRCRDIDLHRWLSGSYILSTIQKFDENG